MITARSTLQVIVDGEAFTGCPVDVVRGMRVRSFFPETGSLADYARWVGDRMGVPIDADASDDDAATALVRGLTETGLATASLMD